MNSQYNLERLKKVEHLYKEAEKQYHTALITGDIEIQATRLLKMGELELEAQELREEMSVRLAGDGVVWREGEERQGVDD